MNTISESVIVNGFDIKIVYDRKNPQYIIKHAQYAKNSADIKITLNALWKTRQYDFLQRVYEFSRSKQSQLHEWAAQTWLHRKTNKDRPLQVDNKRNFIKKLFYFFCSLLLG
jgi:hypothetical protein